ncbi:hypothetical protein AM500_13735 [Bacillus sp. FJAT-18017]|uniref:hypothetical protein n=1 Tax=Bacillus sp. FJAT-18017 TaxID=1705566 RepID=UPI0006AEDED1|nr:hypothetical protein [Bacillus sp. FJAT-18017]ALC90729.1 hypothetical protein AM500_13735 [Bacillus sp. FJAT-18017]
MLLFAPLFISLLTLGLCFYFTLSFFQYLHQNDERAMLQSKKAATLCLILAIGLIPFGGSLIRFLFG